MLSSSNIFLKISSHTPFSSCDVTDTHTLARRLSSKTQMLGNFTVRAPTKLRVCEFLMKKKRGKENMKLIFPSKTLEKKINTRFMWNETEENTNDFSLFFSGSGVCVMLRCFCISRESFCLFRTNCGKWKNARENYFRKTRTSFKSFNTFWRHRHRWFTLMRVENLTFFGRCSHVIDGAKFCRRWKFLLVEKPVVFFFRSMPIKILLSFSETTPRKFHCGVNEFLSGRNFATFWNDCDHFLSSTWSEDFF